jgi:hypothetical protein
MAVDLSAASPDPMHVVGDKTTGVEHRGQVPLGWNGTGFQSFNTHRRKRPIAAYG